MPQYLLSVQHSSVEELEAFPPEDMPRLFKQVDAFNDEVRAAGAWVFGGGLTMPATATTVRPQGDGEVLLTDGPFAETKEFMGGFWVIEAPDLDAALDWARRGALACEGPVEVRPFQEEDQAG
jgi:hypothetical protein